MEVLYEDNHLIIVNKTCREIVQGDKTGDRTLLDEIKDYLKTKYNKPGNVFLGLTHRLDRPTSGLVVFAKTSKALERMNALFASHDVRKTYWAIVKEVPPAAEMHLENYLRRNEKQNKSYVAKNKDKDAKLAILDFQMIASSDRYHLLSVNLHTGRHHQIRCQLAHIGCPIKGDLKYGFARSNPDGGISLHARHIEFEHPVTHETVSVTAPVPNDNLWKEFEKSVG